MAKKSVCDIEVPGKRVLVRVDFNVPLDPKTGAISDDSRLRASLPTLQYLIEKKAKVVVCSHLGRPDGKVKEDLRLAPVARRLAQLLGKPVATTTNCVGPEAEKAVAALKPGEVLMLENLRFHPEEEENDDGFSRALARLADIYVNDAFGTAHRAHASTAGVAKYLPAVAGFLMEKEVRLMDQALENPARPFAVVIGGAKVSDKMGLLGNLLDKVDVFLIGGGMASTFLKAQGQAIGDSLVEEDKVGFARDLLKKTAEKKLRLLLPSDVVIAQKLEANAETRVVATNQVPAGWRIVDIGPKTLALFGAELKRCHTIIWNGPMGVFEYPPFAQGTKALAQLLASLKATTIVGGGSTAEAVEEMGLASKMSHVSTGGGASLTFLAGKTLPGVAVLLDK